MSSDSTDDRIRELYSKDTQISDERVDFVCDMYKRKVDMYACKIAV